MNKKIALGVAILVTCLLGLMIYGSISLLAENKIRQTILTSKKDVFNQMGYTLDDLEGKTVVIYFNSECPNCKNQIKSIGDDIEHFNNVTLALVTTEDPNQAVAFLSKYGLDGYYLEVEYQKLAQTFKGGVPQILIYKSDNLTNHFKGEVNTQTILDALNDNLLQE